MDAEMVQSIRFSGKSNILRNGDYDWNKFYLG